MTQTTNTEPSSPPSDVNTFYDKEVSKAWSIATAAKVPTTYEGRPVQGAVLTGLYIPFWDLVMLLVKLAFAAIPAVIIIVVTITGVMMVLGGIGEIAHWFGQMLQSLQIYLEDLRFVSHQH
jgi:hypothetical protein